MRGSLFLAMFVCLLAVGYATGQTLSVNERKAVASVQENQLLVNLPIRSSRHWAAVRVGLEVLDENDTIVASAGYERRIDAAVQPFEVPVSSAQVLEKLLWYRLRYRVSHPDSPAVVENTVAVSEVMPDLFELQVTAPHSVFSGMNVRAHVVALHPYSKKPIGNVDVSGILQLHLDTDEDEDEMKIDARARTNSEGIATLDFKIPSGVSIDYDAELSIEGKKNGVIRKADSSLDVSQDSFVYLYTDKPLYQPGQKLYIRGLYLDPARRPLAGQELDIVMEDEGGETVLERTVTTSRFGVVSIEWPIPADLKLGEYRIRVHDDDSHRIGSAEIKISRYDLPNFVVDAKPQKPFYLLTDTFAEVSVSAAYLFGQPVQGGSVRVVEEIDRTWNFDDQEYDTNEGEAYTGTANPNGTFTAKVSLASAAERLKKDEWVRFVDVKFAAYYTDPTTNRTEQKRFDIRVSREPIHVYFIRAAADPNPAIPFLFYVSAFYADGSPVKADLELSGYYDNAYTSQTLAAGRTNSYGAAKFELTFPESPFTEAKNEFNFNITARDRSGNTGTLNENIYVDPGSRLLRVKTDKTIYSPGEQINVKVLSTETGTVIVEVLKNSSSVWSKPVALKNGVGSVTVPYRSDLKGELTIIAHRPDDEDDRSYSFWSKTVIFPAPSELSIDLNGAKGSYRPGEDARLAFNVRTGDGRAAAEAALGVVMIDKAIEERARTERLRDNMSDLRKLLGTADAFGELTRKDLDKIDTTKPISSDLQLAAEYLLVNKFNSPRSFASESYTEDFGSIYREPMRKRLWSVTESLMKRFEESFEFPAEREQLVNQLARDGLSLDEFQDSWGMPFQITFRKDRGDVVLEFGSSSADKKAGNEDDFSVSEVRFQWFAATQARINKVLETGDPNGPKPRTAEELSAVLSAAGVDVGSIRDAWGRSIRIESRIYTRSSIKTFLETVGNLDGARQEVARTRVVEQEVALHNFVSSGADGVAGNSDDITLGATVVQLSERDLMSESGGKVKLSKGPTSSNRGAIAGTITDPIGAVIPGAKVVGTNSASRERFEVATNDEGVYLLANLPSGRYSVRAEAPGFSATVIENVIVSAYNVVKVDIELQVGAVSSVVEVTGGDSPVINTTNSAVANSVTRSEAKSLAGLIGKDGQAQTFTPRVREYFPETLIWQPELITDKRGRAGINFKLADSLTTWKLYAFGSTETGEFGMVERELQTFQPFFAELDPPKVLTEGDQVSLPVPVRNYTNKRQRVTVSMEQNAWSRMPNGNSRQIVIAPNSTENAVIDLVAASPVVDGRQRVTALAGKEGDSVEKPVTVRPNGREEVRTRSQTFSGSTVFNVDFPETAFPNHRSALLKIYPDLLAHVGESVEGLLQRPHGCGEQTTSSTYPNLMILKLEKDLGKQVSEPLKKKARAYLLDGYKRLLNYQTPSGGFSYWGRNDTPNPALTAYVIRFLSDAEEFIDVDPSVVGSAKRWLEGRQSSEGVWADTNGSAAASTAYILRSLMHKPDAVRSDVIRKGFSFLESSSETASDPYVLANTALIALQLGERPAADKALHRLAEKAQTSDAGISWPTASTPFYGWGRAAEVETTAVAVRAFAEFKKTRRPDEKGIQDEELLISGGLKFILANKDGAGVWYSTQTTVNVLITFIALQHGSGASAPIEQSVAIMVNGASLREVPVPAGSLDPFFIEIGEALKRSTNSIEIKGSSSAMIGAQLVVKHYDDWASAASDDRYFDFKVAYDKPAAAVGEEITCSVEMRRRNYTGHGMILMEIGLPPGADVDRPSLDAAQGRGAFSRYDILPDKVVIYSWSSSRPMSLSFTFKHRYPINAQTAPSVVYDYYNPEASAYVRPVRFQVR